MTLTFEELKEKMKDTDEITLLEDLEISSDEIVERFEDKIDLKYDQLIKEYEEDDEE